MTPYRNNLGQKDITQIYDYWIFQTTPWEHMGYDKRDELRQGEKESFLQNNYLFYYNNVVLANDADNPFRSNWKVGSMWLEKTYVTKSSVSYDILRRWHRYDSNDTQFFYTTIERQYPLASSRAGALYLNLTVSA